MNEIISAIVASLITGIITYMLTKMWIRAARKFNLVGRDMNKFNKPEVAEAGGISVIIGISTGLFLFVFINALLNVNSHLVEIFGITSAVLLSGFIGFSDDILGWKKGIPQRYKPVLTSVIALPFITIVLVNPQYNSFTFMGVPLWLYAYLFVPVGIIGTSNAINMVAGYNGLEAGLSIIILTTLAIQAYILGEIWISLVAMLAVASLLAFLVFNWYPAKVFPGDSLTYPVGAFIGAVVILGNMEIFGACLFPLFFMDFLLYLKAKKIDHAGDVQAFGVPDEHNNLGLPYSKIYDSCHFAIVLQKKIRGLATEKGVVMTLYMIQIAISLIVLFFFNFFNLWQLL